MSRNWCGLTWSLEGVPRRELGRTGLLVSHLAFGSLPLAPWAAGSGSAGEAVLEAAFAAGINLVDTAELYNNYSRLAGPLRRFPDALLLTKSYAVTAADLERSLDKVRRETGREVIDIFLLHEVESEAQLRGHAAAWERLLLARERGEVRAAGISTHRLAAVRAADRWPGVEVILTIVNRQGYGLQDGTLAEMLALMEERRQEGIGILAMKVLGGGALWQDSAASLAFVRDLPFVDALVVGMASWAELAFNMAVLSGKDPGDELRRGLAAKKRRVVVEEWCTGCGRCLAACGSGALGLVEGRARVDEDLCLRCGYCIPRCPDLYLKIL